MSKFDDIKNRVRSGTGSVHSEFIADEPRRRKRVKKPKFEETHTRDTNWIRNDLMETLKEWSEEGGRGEKTRIINEALEDYFRRNKDTDDDIYKGFIDATNANKEIAPGKE